MAGYKYVANVDIELKKLAEFPAKVEARVVRGALRAAGKVVQQVIKPRVPRGSGDLVGTLKVGVRKKGKTITAAVKIGNRKKGVFYAHMVMGGTKPHLISARRQPALSFGGLVRAVVQHPGARANDFMNEANIVAREPALQAAFKFATDQLRRLIAEQGNAP